MKPRAQLPGSRLGDGGGLAEPFLALATVWSVLLVAAWAGIPNGGSDLLLLAGFGAAAAVAWTIRPRGEPWAPVAAAGAIVAGFALYPAVSGLVVSVGIGLDLEPVSARAPGARGPALWIATVALAPLFEEWLYRGRLLDALCARVGAVPAAIASSTLFAISHIEPWGVLATFLVGLGLAALRLLGRAPLAVLIGLHAGLNAASLTCGAPPQRLALDPAAGAGVGGAILVLVHLHLRRGTAFAPARPRVEPSRA